MIAAAALAAAAILAAPNVHDLVLGNVMALYVGAVAVPSPGRDGWGDAARARLRGRAQAGDRSVSRLARDPAPRRLRRTLAVASPRPPSFAVVVGPGRYVEYSSRCRG